MSLHTSVRTQTLRGNLGRQAISKVPQVTLGFWLIKIVATTLGETGGDWVTMSLKLGYVIGTLIFMAIFIALVAVQVKSRKFHPSLYWATIVGTTTLGTTIADFADRSLGLGYPGGVAIISALLIASLGVWYPAKDRSGRLDLLEPPNLGALITKCAGTGTPAQHPHAPVPTDSKE